MGQNKPIEPIRLYIKSLRRFCASFWQKMNAARVRSVKDSEREVGEHARLEICSENRILVSERIPSNVQEREWKAQASAIVR